MERVILFNALQLLASGYAIARGGAPERLAGVSLVIAALSTRLLQSAISTRFVKVEAGMLVVDLILLIVLLVIAANADRYWTMWMAALQALGAGAHLVRLLDHDVLRFVYALLTAIWSYPIVILLVAGTARHRRRMAGGGGDLDWSRQEPIDPR